MSRRRALFGIAVLAQLAFLGFVVARAEWVLRHGERVVLEIVARDPYDLLRGYYQRIELAVNELDRALGAPGTATLTEGERIYVRLFQDGDVHRAVGFARQPPPGDAQYLAGTVESLQPDTLRVDYGLDRFYVPMDAADPNLVVVPPDAPRPELRLVVRLNAGGGGMTEDLLVDGQPFAEWNRDQAR